MKVPFKVMILSLLSSHLYAQVDSDLSIYPSITHFGSVTLGQQSTATAVTVTNDHTTDVLTLGTSSITGIGADQFKIITDNCSGQALVVGAQCSVSVAFAPTQFGSKLAMLEVPSSDIETPILVVFLSNDEDAKKQAERRLPPVLYSLTIPEIMDADTTYTLQWSLLGYHESYSSIVALFDCTGKAANTCGSSAGDNFANSGFIQPDAIVTSNTWSYAGETAKEMQYSFSFKPRDFKNFSDGDSDVVVRFYRKNTMDSAAQIPSMSLLIPGNLSDRYYDAQGRRITKTINQVSAN